MTRNKLAICLSVALSHSIAAAVANAAPMTPAEFEAVAAKCAPNATPGILEAVAKTESGLDFLALHDNTTGVSERAPDLQSALSEADAWVARGDSVDIGIMQVNSKNLPSLNMSLQDALDACASVAAGATILQAAYTGGETSAEQQTALLMALSRYNTGTPFKGILNGYAHRVLANEPHAGMKTTLLAAPPVVAPPADPKAPPSWDVFAAADYAETHGAPWLVYTKPNEPAASPVASVSKAILLKAEKKDAEAHDRALSTTQETMRQ